MQSISGPHLLRRPLHYCALGARSIDAPPGATVPYSEVAQTLIAAGARVDSRDIAGYTPLSVCAGYISTKRSLEVGTVLVDAGASVKAITRFGEGLLVPSIMVRFGVRLSLVGGVFFCASVKRQVN